MPTTLQPKIILTERGLSIEGTRITLYDVMDYLVAGYPETLIAEKLTLGPEQLASALAYIRAHEDSVRAEYEHVLATGAENRAYWEGKARSRVRPSSTPTPSQQALLQKLTAWKTKLDQ